MDVPIICSEISPISHSIIFFPHCFYQSIIFYIALFLFNLKREAECFFSIQDNEIYNKIYNNTDPSIEAFSPKSPSQEHT